MLIISKKGDLEFRQKSAVFSGIFLVKTKMMSIFANKKTIGFSKLNKHTNN